MVFAEYAEGPTDRTANVFPGWVMTTAGETWDVILTFFE